MTSLPRMPVWWRWSHAAPVSLCRGGRTIGQGEGLVQGNVCQCLGEYLSSPLSWRLQSSFASLSPLSARHKFFLTTSYLFFVVTITHHHHCNLSLSSFISVIFIITTTSHHRWHDYFHRHSQPLSLHDSLRVFTYPVWWSVYIFFLLSAHVDWYMRKPVQEFSVSILQGACVLRGGSCPAFIFRLTIYSFILVRLPLQNFLNEASQVFAVFFGYITCLSPHSSLSNVCVCSPHLALHFEITPWYSSHYSPSCCSSKVYHCLSSSCFVQFIFTL